MSKHTQFGNYLRSRRQQNGLSLRDLSRLSGVAHSTISDIERGHDPKLSMIVKLGQAFSEDWTPWKSN